MNAPRIAIHAGQRYVTAEYRGTSYCLSRHGGDAWGVATRRLALGRHNMGGYRTYETLAELAAGCKAFGSEADLVALVFGVPLQAAEA